MTERDIDNLEKQVLHHRYLYYVVGRPVISDDAFDAIEAVLREHRPDSPALHGIGHEEIEPDSEHPHPEIMGSIDFTRSVDEFMDWYSQFAAGSDLVLMPKVDGLACRKEFSGGVLKRALTRGDGEKGLDVTLNCIHAENIVSELSKAGDGYVEERGEVFMPKRVLKELNAALPADKQIANCRNAAAGSLRLHNPKESAKRRLHMLAYDLRGYAANECKTELEKAELAKAMGIKYVPVAPVKGTNKVGRKAFKRNIERTLAMWENTLREQLPYDIDGLVFAINDLAIQEDAGWTSKAPKGKFALKFASESVATPVTAVVWQTGRGGKVTPVAEFEPVDLMGTTVIRATLHNRQNVQQLGIVPGSIITIEKCGDIIPGVVASAGVIGGGDPEIPEYCPVCGSPLEDEGPFLMCRNRSCSGQSEGRLEHFCKKVGLKGFGARVCQSLVKIGVDDYAALLAARQPDYMAAGITGKTMTKLLDQILELKEIPLETFLASLAIPRLDSKARNMAETFCTLDAILDASETQLMERLEQIGPKLAKGIRRGLDKNHARIQEALKYVKVPPHERKIGHLTGKSVCITGKLSRGKAEWKAAIEDAGGIWASSCGARTDYLVTPGPDWVSEKTKRASKLGVTVISERQLESLVRTGETD